MKNHALFVASLFLFVLAGAVGAQTSDPAPTPAPAQESVWKTFFPDGLLDPEGNKVEPDVLNGKLVGLYFSAHWCPPCRMFSPMLVAFRDAHTSDFEVVFISSDKNREAQFEYMKEVGMKWYTLEHRSEAANALAQKYGVRSIPTLIILGPDGKTITEDGRADVTKKPDSCLADWKAAAGR
ncbi:MAG: Thioredoxin [Candidatus Ozemobacter sibiricus]|jgi:nucleoredoxin|uniref:Thioredoxin n=1 Tax=Candidatus Ozemobacter sibiricus TaxID=2268124 RepID=A0A367ZKV4_9BACT|nr:MAG: Thioredoxin [Candidatus Ozemobacter sibiricus]